MIVSEHELWIRSLDSTFGPHGFKVVPAASAREALRQVQTDQPDLLIIHTDLRDSSGFQLCEQMRNQRLIDSYTPVVIITGVPCNRQAQLDALRAGAWDCYGFPPDPELLLLKLLLYARATTDIGRARGARVLAESTRALEPEPSAQPVPPRSAR